MKQQAKQLLLFLCCTAGMFLTHVQGVRASHVASGGDVAEMTPA